MAGYPVFTPVFTYVATTGAVESGVTYNPQGPNQNGNAPPIVVPTTRVLVPADGFVAFGTVINPIECSVDAPDVRPEISWRGSLGQVALPGTQATACAVQILPFADPATMYAAAEVVVHRGPALPVNP